jgi:hypothetical protein
MDFIEYELKKKFLKEIYDREIVQLKRELALSNNTVEVGNIIRDKEGYIQVKTMGVYLSEFPCCYYDGIVFSNKKVPTKIEKKRRIYQTNIIKDENK